MSFSEISRAFSSDIRDVSRFLSSDTGAICSGYGGSATLCQVLPAWLRKRPKEPGPDADERERLHWQAMFKAFVDGDDRTKGQSAVELTRMANMHYVKALDRTITLAANVGLDHFAPRSFPKALGPDEKRFFVADKVIQEMKGLEEHDPERERVCVKDKVANSTRLELPGAADGKRPQLHINLDEGSIGFPTALWLYLSPVIRGTFHPDPCHRVMNNLTNALKSAGLWIITLEVLVVMNLPTRPYNSDSEWQKLVGAASELHRCSGPDNEMFQCLYSAIVEEGERGPIAPTFGSVEHMQEVWDSVQHATFLKRKGKKVKLGRWMAWFDRFREFRTEWSTLYLQLLNMGMSLKWWPDLASSPLYRPIDNLPSMEPAAMVGVVEGEAPQKQPVKSSNKDPMKALRESCKNAAHMSCCILSSTRTRRLANMIFILVEPLQLDFGCMIVSLKTLDGTMRWLKMMASGGHESVLADILSRALGDSHLQAMGFWATSSLESEPFAWELAEDKVVASYMLTFALHLFSQQMLWSLGYSEMPPWVFFKLLEPNLKASALDRLKVLWARLEDDEAKAHNDKTGAIVAHLDLMIWPRLIIVREWFLSLAEYGFKKLPQLVADDLEELGHSFATTKCVEDMFKVLRDFSRHSPNNECSRKTRWLKARESHVLSDYGRPQVVCDTLEVRKQAASLKVTNATFEQGKHSFSLGDCAYSKLGGKPTWPTISPLEFLKSPLYTMSLETDDLSWKQRALVGSRRESSMCSATMADPRSCATPWSGSRPPASRSRMPPSSRASTASLSATAHTANSVASRHGRRFRLSSSSRARCTR